MEQIRNYVIGRVFNESAVVYKKFHDFFCDAMSSVFDGLFGYYVHNSLIYVMVLYLRCLCCHHGLVDCDVAVFHYDLDVVYVRGARESFEDFAMSVMPVILTVAGMSVMLTMTPGMSGMAFMTVMSVAVIALLIMIPLCP